MGRPKKNAASATASTSTEIPDVDIADINEKVFPKATPKNEDGSVAQEKEVSIDLVKQIGAVGPESARKNKDLDRVVRERMTGNPNQTRWGSKDLFEIWDAVAQAWSQDRIYVVVHRVDPEPPLTWEAGRMGNHKNAHEFYNWVKRNCHKGQRSSAKYRIQFREGGRERGQAELYMPEVEEEEIDMNRQPPYPHYPPPVMYGYPPPPQPSPYGYPAPPQPPPPPAAAPPPPSFAAPQPPPTAPAVPPLTPVVIQSPPAAPAGPDPSIQQHLLWLQEQIQRLMPQAPNAFPPSPRPLEPPVQTPSSASSQDLQVAALLAAVQALTQKVDHSQLQMAQTLGYFEALRSMGLGAPPPSPAVPPSMPPHSPPPAPPGGVATYPHGPPPGYGYPPPSSYGAPPNYGAPPPGPMAGSYPYGYPVPAPPQAAPPQNPMQSMMDVAAMVKDAARMLENVRSAAGGGSSAAEDDVPPPPPVPPKEEDPYVAMPLGNSPDSPTYVFNRKDGSPNVTGTVMANLDKAPKWLAGIASAVKEMRAEPQAAHPRPMIVHAQPVELPRHEVASMPSPPAPATAPSSTPVVAPAVEQAPPPSAAPSLIPPIDAFR